ncbi:MAG: hypothetical protein HQ568_04585 [Calditrichaeota bacterium]|nr:hypothetical protein [Calditrichota bacterium]
MLNTIRELVQFYAQKYHVAMHTTWENWMVNNSKPGIIVGYPSSAEKSKKLGKLKFNYDPKFGETVEGKVIEIKGLPMLKIGERDLLLLFSPINKPAKDLMKALIDEHLPRLARQFKKEQREQFMSQLTTCADSMKEEMVNQISADEYELNDLSNRMTELARKVTTARHLKQFFESSDDILKRQATRMWIDLMKLVPGTFSSFRFEGNRITGVTQIIEIVFEDYRYVFQPYQVEVDIRDGEISITGDSNMVDTYIHPHVSDENVCWGNIGGLVQRLVGELNLHGLFQLIHQFLSTYNQDDPFLRIERWNPHWEDDENYDDDPYCCFCDDYGHIVDDCDACWWCDDCRDYVDHPRDECPNQKEVIDEAA